MSVPPELTVLLDRVVVGTLTPLPASHLHRFRYTDGWIGDPYAYPVSLALPLAAPEYEGLAVRNWLRGLLPDNEARLLEVEREYAVSRDDPYAVLAHIGEDCVGAVQFARPERAEEIASGPAKFDVEWLDDETLETLLGAVAARSSPDRRAVPTGQFSLPGALGKVALVRDEVADRWGRPTGQWPSTHILKPPMPGVPWHNENEHYCLRLAEAAGLPAVASEIVRAGAQSAISVVRYDRQRHPGGGLSRLHQEDMAQALGLDPQLKYAAEGGAGVREIVRLLRDHAHPDDVGVFVRYVGFAWIAATTDAHLRNFSLLMTLGQNTEIAPLYDVASALGLPGGRGRRTPLRLAMAIGGTTALDDIDGAAWEREIERSRLPKSVLAEVSALCERVSEEAGGVAERLIAEQGLDAGYLRRLARDLTARANGCFLRLSRRP